jgi:small conductance mechanosensitive channel
MNNKKSKKNTILKWILLTLGFIGTVVTVIFDPYIFGETSIFNQAISNNEVLNAAYQKIPALIRSIEIIVLSSLLYHVVKLLLRASLGRTNRGLTIAKLLESFLKWVIAIAALLFVLNSWGVDAGALLASAGLVTLIIGLGAQSLVADIVAGVFIVFEGEFQVGDIVIINNWRGTVLEIGIRTTKVVDAGGNVNIVNNSEITTIVNQTQDISLATCTVGIEYGESLTRVEMVVSQNLEKIKEHIPAIMEGPFYKGVKTLNTSSVDLLFVAKCREEDLFQVQRDMNREFKLLFDEYNINIPFAQIVLNQPTAKAATDSTAVKNAARKFMEEQKELSANIQLEEEK